VGDNYTNDEDVARQKPTKDERVQAVNILLEIIKQHSAKDIYEYVMTPKFQKLAVLTKLN